MAEDLVMAAEDVVPGEAFADKEHQVNTWTCPPFPIPDRLTGLIGGIHI